ncbi:hypothetical protein TST_0491 [Thermosulfidibacter takaii ABI70S6]|uniref:Uncharacterized protein n=1 Tax=Thermosulfidibacter takaii (strain DSM 17441 / JCM 13301 / NBRC 103674 / ABI70S6) TaxID=1298851 RepID=A0A0S3QSH9_THET7|nr:hypothetical protein [Thermosulfidibacter takaii]BAT71298.1 hypothetical protein TST_0491 [Thermosulfidibacter takaii ABI70S6]
MGREMLHEYLIPYFGFCQAVGKLMEAAALGKLTARELVDLQKLWKEETDDDPPRVYLHAGELPKIKRLAEEPLLKERDLEALGRLLQEMADKLASSVMLVEGSRFTAARAIEQLQEQLKKYAKHLDSDLPWAMEDFSVASTGSRDNGRGNNRKS